MDLATIFLAVVIAFLGALALKWLQVRGTPKQQDTKSASTSTSSPVQEKGVQDIREKPKVAPIAAPPADLDVLILYGSQKGTAKGFAELLCRECETKEKLKVLLIPFYHL